MFVHVHESLQSNRWMDIVKCEKSFYKCCIITCYLWGHGLPRVTPEGKKIVGKFTKNSGEAILDTSDATGYLCGIHVWICRVISAFNN